MNSHDVQAAAAALTITRAELDCLLERRRQVEVEGWTPEHDDQHEEGSLALAAACYATPIQLYEANTYGAAAFSFGDPWPWNAEWDKRPRDEATDELAEPTPEARRRMLVKANALILAEIERLDRAAAADEEQAA